MNKDKFTSRIVIIVIFMFLVFSSIVVASIYFLYGFSHITKVTDYNSNLSQNNYVATTSPREIAIAYLGDGLDYYDAKDYTNTEIYYRKAIEADPSYALPYSNLGIILDDTNRQDEARKNYDKAIELDPKYPKSYNNIGYDYFIKKDYVNAEVYYNKSIQADPDYYLPYLNLGDLYLEGKIDVPTAKMYYNKALLTKSISAHDSDSLRQFINRLK